MLYVHPPAIWSQVMRQAVRFSVEFIRSEVSHRLESGRLHRLQPLSSLREFYSADEWQSICEVLELHDIQLHDPVCDLLGSEEWSND